jgi:hypothetical protein
LGTRNVDIVTVILVTLFRLDPAPTVTFRRIPHN